MAFEIEADCNNLKTSFLHAEPIIAAKIYDSCRVQDCLTSIARAAEPIYINDEYIKIGEIIPVVSGAGSVKLDEFKLIKSTIVSKTPSPFKKGFWLIEVEFVYEYTLNFFDCTKKRILSVKAYSSNKKNFALFGSVSPEITLATDFFAHTGCPTVSSSEPYALSESKAIALKAEFRCNHCDLQPVDVAITIGLFSIIKLFRIVCINVESRGFYIPRKCETNLIEPCDFFNKLDFPIGDFEGESPR